MFFFFFNFVVIVEFVAAFYLSSVNKLSVLREYANKHYDEWNNIGRVCVFVCDVLVIMMFN